MHIYGKNTTIGGGNNNIITASTNSNSNSNSTTTGGTFYIKTQYSTIGGGSKNTIQCNNNTATYIASTLIIDISGSTISGGVGNLITSTNTCYCATIGGGKHNTASGYCVVVSGGINNIASGIGSTIGGGGGNMANDYGSTIGGGAGNIASGINSTIGGGGFFYNAITDKIYLGNTASGFGSTISGGLQNTASGDNSIVAGGSNNVAAGNYSWVGGHSGYARNADSGSFVWGGNGKSSVGKVISAGTNAVHFAGIADYSVPTGENIVGINTANGRLGLINMSFTGVVFMIAVQGYLPLSTGTAVFPAQYIGEIRMVAFNGSANYPPVGWMACNGQLLLISDNATLYTLLGKKYGGDGITHFAVPNFNNGNLPQGNVPIQG